MDDYFYFERLKMEADEVAKWETSLREFRRTNQCAELDQHHQELITTQHKAMKKYLSVLTRRISITALELAENKCENV